jgi:copper transport protein
MSVEPEVSMDESRVLHGRRWAGLGLLTALLLALAAPSPAAAHAFGVRTAPVHGARLAQPPREVLLQFTEAVLPDSAEVSVTTASGSAVVTAPPRLDSGDRVVRAALGELDEGVAIVSWQVVAESDGHVTAGEFAFAVGAATGRLPAASSGEGVLSLAAAAGNALLFAGLALAAGALVVAGFAGLQPRQAADLARLSRWALVAAAVGSGLPLLRLVPALAGTTGGTAAVASPAGGVVATVATLTLALLVVAVGARRGALALVAVAAAFWATTSHAAAYRGALASAVDAVHLGAATAWAGSLVVVAALLWRARGDGREVLLRLVAQYARLALWLVVVAVVSGVVSAAGLLTGVGDLLVTRYGQVLLTKAALVAAALALATLARTRFLPRERVRPLRRSVSAEAGALTFVLAATAALTSLGPPVATATAETLLGPPPLSGRLARAAGLAGNLNVSLVAGDEQLQVRVFTPSGPAEGTEVEVDAELPDGRRATLRPRPCGEGCLTQQFPLLAGTTHVTVEATAPNWTGGTFTGKLTWPPPANEPALLRAVAERMRRVPALELTEQVSSGPGATALTVTPMSGETYIELAPYAAGAAVDVRRVPGERDALEFVLEDARMHFTLWLDDDGRVARERIVSPGHEIERTLTYPEP